MCHFLETIRIEQGKVWNLPYHLARMERTLMELGVESSAFARSLSQDTFGKFSSAVTSSDSFLVANPATLSLNLHQRKYDWVQRLNPHQGGGERVKCRVLYTAGGIEEIEYAPYTLRPLQTVQLLAADSLDYHLKGANREALNQLFAQRGGADEVVITQNGCLTDSTIANLALFDGRDWITPQRPLLAGTKRAQLLAHGVLKEGTLRVDDLSNYQRIRFFNALMEWGELELPVSALLR